MRVKGLGPVDDALAQARVQLLEHGLAEAGADVAHRLKGLGGGVVAGEQKGTVHGGALALAVVGAQDDEVERVADAG